MTDVLQKVNKIRKQIQQSNEAKAVLTGRKKQLLDQLKNDFDIDSIDEAELEVVSLTKKSKESEEKLDTLVKQLDSDMQEFQEA